MKKRMKNSLAVICIALCFLSAYSQNSVKTNNIVMEQDSVVVPASSRYDASFLRKIFTGANYREEWSTPVKMPVFDLKKSGLVITKMGGGQQTRSLRLEDSEGREWALRTVDKFVEGALPKLLQNTLAERVVQDMVSAAHPYGALPVSELARSMGILAARPVLYFVPDSEDLGEHRKLMANQVCFLEERDPAPNPEESEDTEDLVEKKLEDHENLVMQRQVLKARLLDMLIADWDRHEDQWSWAEKDSAGNNYYYPVPRDRDQAFFISGGLIPRIGKLIGMRHINHFKEESRSIKDLSYKAWNFDKQFLNDLDAQEWERTIREVQALLTDAVIDRAVRKLPPEIYALSGKNLSDKLKSRRDGLLENTMRYYRFLAARTYITGSDESELFKVKPVGEDLQVSVYQIRNNQTGRMIFNRVFKESETSLITLSGLKGEDKFEIEEGNTGIKLEVFKN